jgi:hypothetical protein
MAAHRVWRTRNGVAIGLVLIAIAVGCAPTTVQRRPVPTHLATEIGYTNGNGSFVIGPDGSRPRMLSTGLPFTGDPRVTAPQPVTGAIAVSPDGGNEAYWRDCDEPGASGPSPATTGLWMATSDGGNAHRIWASPGCFAPSRSDYSTPVPHWTSNGTELAIGVNIDTIQQHFFGILLVRPDGTGAHYLADRSGHPIPLFSVGALAWSPDGQDLAFVDTSDSLVVAPAAGGQTRLIARLPPVAALKSESYVLPGSLSWSPDGRTILAAVGFGVDAFPASGGSGKLIYQAAQINSAYYSPDGARIVMTGAPTGIELSRADGTGVSVLPDTAGISDSAQVTGWFGVRIAPGPMATSSGYWVVASDGRVASYGGAYGGPKTPPTSNVPIGAIVSGAYALGYGSRVGYQLIATDGELVDAGTVRSSSTYVHNPSTPIVAVCGNNFVTTAGIFFGTDDAAPFATLPHSTAPIVAAACGSNNLIFTADGTVYRQEGNPPSAVGMTTDTLYTVTGLTAPIVGMTPDLATGGYWLVGRDGNVYGFNAPVEGSLRDHPLSAPVVGIADDEATGGYWIVTSDGVVLGFNAPIEQQTSGPDIASRVVGIAAASLSSSLAGDFSG